MTAPVLASGYAVRVASERSEGRAQAAFRALQAKYPNPLGGHQPIIRRADLGDTGTYYRALIGPFATAANAAKVCSALKAAGRRLYRPEKLRLAACAPCVGRGVLREFRKAGKWYSVTSPNTGYSTRVSE